MFGSTLIRTSYERICGQAAFSVVFLYVTRKLLILGVICRKISPVWNYVIQVAYAGVCHSDSYMALGLIQGTVYPRVLGNIHIGQFSS